MDGEAAQDGAQMETEQMRRERFRGMYVVYFTMFQLSLGFSIVLTSVWPYLDKLQPESPKWVMGLAAGANPLGQLLSSPLVGLWANRRVRAPLLSSLALAVLANVMYAQLHLTRPYASYWMVFSRFLFGVSSGSIVVLRSYLSAATTTSERTAAVSRLSFAQLLGFVIGPALQSAASPLGPGDPYPPLGETGPIMRLDMYTAAGWINVVLTLINVVLVLPWCFKVRRVAAKEAMLAQGAKSEEEALQSLKPDLVGSSALVISFFMLSFTFVLLEALATPLTMDQFGWSKTQAVMYMGFIMVGGSVLASVTFCVISPLTKCVKERTMLWVGFALTCAASLLCVPWGPGPPPAAGGGEARGGCPAALQPWCPTSRRLTLTQFLLAYALVSVGYTLGIVLIQTIFSKVLGPRPQGVWMAALTCAGCVSRAAGPVLMTAVYTWRGPALTFGTTAAVTAAALAGLCLVSSRLDPMPLGPRPIEMGPLVGHQRNDDHAAVDAS